VQWCNKNEITSSDAVVHLLSPKLKQDVSSEDDYYHCTISAIQLFEKSFRLRYQWSEAQKAVELLRPESLRGLCGDF